MKTFTKISLLCIISLCLTVTVSFAQEAQEAQDAQDLAIEDQKMTIETEDMATEAEMYFASGSVIEATETQIIISEYDFDAGQDTKITYQVNAQTQLEGVAAVADIKPGDDVEIEYQLVGDQKIATRVEKYAPEVAEEVEPAVPSAEMEKMNEETQQQLNTEAEAMETNN
ncbi:MAG: hypothetical protein WCX16_00665 [Candidatus Omnitrophota bacterium]